MKNAYCDDDDYCDDNNDSTGCKKMIKMMSINVETMIEVTVKYGYIL